MVISPFGLWFILETERGKRETGGAVRTRIRLIEQHGLEQPSLLFVFLSLFCHDRTGGKESPC